MKMNFVQLFCWVETILEIRKVFMRWSSTCLWVAHTGIMIERWNFACPYLFLHIANLKVNRHPRHKFVFAQKHLFFFWLKLCISTSIFCHYKKSKKNVFLHLQRTSTGWSKSVVSNVLFVILSHTR